MKKFTFLSLFVCLFVCLATTANAQVSELTEVFGKYRFTATMEVTEYGKQYESLFSNDCEVIITKSDEQYYSVMVQGFAGGTAANIYPSGFDVDAQALSVLNPNAGQWGSSLAMSFAEGGYPYGDPYYNTLLWTFDSATKTFTVPDFSIVGGLDHKAGTAELVAKFTNVKMVQTEAEVVEIPNIEGDYDYKPVDGYVRNDSTFASTFTMVLKATDDTNKAYDATITFGDFAPFTLPATFDGQMLTIPYDSLFLVDGENEYFFAIGTSATEKTGAITFQYQDETSLMQWDGIYIRQDSVWTVTKDETTGEEVGRWGFPIVQKLSWGYATREIEGPAGFSWAGTYKVSSTKVVADPELAATFGEWPEEFNIVIEEKMGGFYVTEFLGFDVYTANQSYSVIKPADDNMSATIALDQYYGMYLLKSLGGGEYLQVFDGGGALTPLTITLNNDGTLTIGNFFIQKTVYGGSTDPKPVVFYQNVTAEKEVKKFDWVSSYTLKADVEVFDNTREWDSEFTVKVEYNEGWGLYLLSEFFNYDNVTSLNYGANSLTIADDTQSATYKTGGYIGGKNPLFFNIYDANSSTTDLNFTVNEDGTISMDDFILYVTDYDGDGKPVKGALYKNVVLTKIDAESIESVTKDVVPTIKGIYDLMGRKYDEITVPGFYIVNGKKVVVK